MLCPNCNRETGSEANLCPFCGAALSNFTFTSQTSCPKPPQHPMEKGTQYYTTPGYTGQAPYYSPYAGFYQPPISPVQPNPSDADQNTPPGPMPNANGASSFAGQPYPAYPYPPYPAAAPVSPNGQTQPQQSTSADLTEEEDTSNPLYQSQTNAEQNLPQPPQQAPRQWYGGQGYPGYLYPNGTYSGAQSQQEAYPSQASGGVMVQEKKRKIWPILLICLSALAVIGTVVPLIVMLLLPKPAGNGLASPQAVADQFMGSILEGNGEQILNMAPDAVIQRLMEEENYASREEMVEEMNTGILMILSYINMMDVSVDYTVGEPQPVDDYITDDLQQTYREMGLTVTDAKEVPVSFTVDGEETSDLTAENLLTVQINGGWYLDITQS